MLRLEWIWLRTCSNPTLWMSPPGPKNRSICFFSSYMMQIENCGADSEMCSENTRFDTAVKLNASAMIWPRDLSNFFHVGRASCVVCAHCRLQHVDSYANQHFLSFVAFVGLVSRCEQFMSLVVLLFCPRMLGMPPKCHQIVSACCSG